MPGTRLSNPATAVHGGSGPSCKWAGRQYALAVLVFASVTQGCASFSSQLGAAVDDADRVAQEALGTTLPESPVQIVFGFRVREADFRFNGRGVARVEPPYKVRVDLFSPQGETLFSAALVGSDLRVPSWAPRDLAPPAPLLWASLGVFRPDPSWTFLGGREGEDRGVFLSYANETRQEVRLGVDRGRLFRAELHRDGHLTEEVDLSLDQSSGVVTETVYRNLAEFLELTFSLESVETVESFPADIWLPGR